MTTTLERLLESVFSGRKFESGHTQITDKQIFKVLARLPYSLSKSQRTAIYRALRNDISYIQGPPGTGKTMTANAVANKLNKKVANTFQQACSNCFS